MNMDPQNLIGKICTSLEKYYDVASGRIRIKGRPVLIIGCEENAGSPMNIDYELLPFSSIENANPDPTYDILIDQHTYAKYGLDKECYLRTHKITWNHVKHLRIESFYCDLKQTDPDLFNKALYLNNQWVSTRTNKNLIYIEENTSLNPMSNSNF